MNNNYLTPSEIAKYTIQSGIKKVRSSAGVLLVLGILAGAFIAFASEGANMAAFNLLVNPETYGLGKALAGAIFSTGLILVLIAGGELFTGNTLVILGVLDKKITMMQMLRNWLLVYIGNFLGSLFIAYAINKTGQLASGANLLGALTIKLAVHKVELGFYSAFLLGILCNWLVCLAVWMSYGAKDITGKIWATFFPIWLFITSGFEHCVANMYYIPAGLFAKENAGLASAAGTLGISAEHLARLTWKNFLIRNLLPVTLGNIVGGAVFVGLAYWFVYIKNQKQDKPLKENEQVAVAKR